MNKPLHKWYTPNNWNRPDRVILVEQGSIASIVEIGKEKERVKNSCLFNTLEDAKFFMIMGLEHEIERIRARIKSIKSMKGDE